MLKISRQKITSMQDVLKKLNSQEAGVECLSLSLKTMTSINHVVANQYVLSMSDTNTYKRNLTS